jgi:hypothetical protein
MAIVKNNPIINGLSGKLGDSIVFKQMRGKTIMCSRPSKPVAQSEQQKETRDRFRKASAWAKSILSDAEQKAYYQKKARKLKLPNAYTAAIADYMRSAKVTQANRYADKTTFIIHKKDFDVARVDVVVNKDSGEKETRTLTKDESYFWLRPAELKAGVVVMVTDAAGIIRQHVLAA